MNNAIDKNNQIDMDYIKRFNYVANMKINVDDWEHMKSFDLNVIWEDILKELKEYMTSNLFDGISNGIMPLELDNTIIRIGILQNSTKYLFESENTVIRALHDAIAKVMGAPRCIILIDCIKK